MFHQEQTTSEHFTLFHKQELALINEITSLRTELFFSLGEQAHIVESASEYYIVQL